MMGTQNEENIQLAWMIFLRIAGISRLDKPPVTSNPSHPDVKAILIMYSLECFLYKTINFASRQKDASKITNLGPFSVALGRIICRG